MPTAIDRDNSCFSLFVLFHAEESDEINYGNLMWYRRIKSVAVIVTNWQLITHHI